MEREQCVADLVNHLTRSNLADAVPLDERKSIVNDYFYQSDSDTSSDTDTDANDEADDAEDIDSDSESAAIIVDPVTDIERHSDLIVSDCKDDEVAKD